MQQKNTGPFSADEVKLLNDIPEARTYMGDVPDSMTIGEMRANVRRMFLGPKTLAYRLGALIADHVGALGPMGCATMKEAITELEWMQRVVTLRPIDELRQEPYLRYGRGVNSGPNRWVILWRDSGYQGVALEGIMGRRVGHGEKFAGMFVGTDGDPVSISGTDPTHFTELPDGVVAPDWARS